VFRRIYSLLRELSLALIVLFGAATAIATFEPSTAWADDDDDWGDDDEDGDDDDDGGGDDDDEEYDDDEEDEEGEDDGYDQPPRWAGGLYTKRTWPQSLVERNLILIGGMAQARVGMDIDMSDRTAFEVWRGVFEGRYGISDSFEVHAGGSAVLTGDVTPTTASGNYNALFFMGFESAIAFELVNFRLTTELLYRAASESIDSDLKFNIGFGFPFRYRFNKKVAIYALERLMTIETGDSPTEVDDNGNPETDKPDFNFGISAAFNPIKELAVTAGASVQVEDFNFKDNAVNIPARIGVLFAPKNTIDLGLQFTFLDLNPAEDPNLDSEDQPKFYDYRSILLYAQLRL
jgi:hypothetical protein